MDLVEDRGHSRLAIASDIVELETGSRAGQACGECSGAGRVLGGDVGDDAEEDFIEVASPLLVRLLARPADADRYLLDLV